MKKQLSLLILASTLYASQEDPAQIAPEISEEEISTDAETSPKKEPVYYLLMFKSPQTKLQLEKALEVGIDTWKEEQSENARLSQQSIIDLYMHFDQLKQHGELLDIAEETACGALPEIKERALLFKVDQPLDIEASKHIEIITRGTIKEIEQILTKKLVEIIREKHPMPSNPMAGMGNMGGSGGMMGRGKKQFPMMPGRPSGIPGANAGAKSRPDSFNQNNPFSRRENKPIGYSPKSQQNKGRTPRQLR